MRKLLSLLSVLIGFASLAQTEVSLTLDASYTKKVFYSFENGEVGSMRNENWDIAIATYSTQTASIRINGGFGAELFQYTGGDTASWNNLDTAGLSTLTNWKQCRDNQSAFEPSAFEANASGHPDYGWGKYNSVTHNVVGTSLFVLKTVVGDYKKVWIKEQIAIGNSIQIEVADLDNTNNYSKTINKSVGSKNYVYLNLATETLMDNEPSNQTYDLVFTKYEGLAGPNAYYPLTGVVLNRGVKSAEVRGLPVEDADLATALFTEDIDVIGSDWKSFNMDIFQWKLQDSLSYFVEDLKGNIWHLWFTDWEGASTGNLKFMQQLVVTSNVSELENKSGIKIYPNPATENFTLQLNEEVTQLSIFDVTGKMVYVNNNLNFNELNLSATELGSGLFLVQTKGKTIETQKLFIK